MTSEMRFKVRVTVVALLTGLSAAYAVAQVQVAQVQSDGLAPPERFDSIADTAARSAALFTELGKVLTHPRCTNCHPAGDHPRGAPAQAWSVACTLEAWRLLGEAKQTSAPNPKFAHTVRQMLSRTSGSKGALES